MLHRCHKLELQLRQLNRLLSDMETDPVLAERVRATRQSMVLHRADCKALGQPVHSAAAAALAVGGADVAQKLAIHRQAGVAKHAELHTEKPLAEVRGQRGKGRRRRCSPAFGSPPVPESAHIDVELADDYLVTAIRRIEAKGDTLAFKFSVFEPSAAIPKPASTFDLLSPDGVGSHTHLTHRCGSVSSGNGGRCIPLSESRFRDEGPYQYDQEGFSCDEPDAERALGHVPQSQTGSSHSLGHTVNVLGMGYTEAHSCHVDAFDDPSATAETATANDVRREDAECEKIVYQHKNDDGVREEVHDLYEAFQRLQASWQASHGQVSDDDPFFGLLVQAIQSHCKADSPYIRHSCADIVGKLKELDPNHWALESFQIKVKAILEQLSV